MGEGQSSSIEEHQQFSQLVKLSPNSALKHTILQYKKNAQSKHPTPYEKTRTGLSMHVKKIFYRSFPKIESVTSVGNVP